jgi:hypothetical protein
MVRLVVKKSQVLPIAGLQIGLEIGLGLAGATVYIEREEKNIVLMGQTNNNGSIEFDDITPGDIVTIKIRKSDLMSDESYEPFECYGRIHENTIINMIKEY